MLGFLTDGSFGVAAVGEITEVEAFIVFIDTDSVEATGAGSLVAAT
jgi:hypothetical protein